jgi:hypothetical protein
VGLIMGIIFIVIAVAAFIGCCAIMGYWNTSYE